MITRALTKYVEKQLQQMPCVFITGPRQSGKSTLATHISTSFMKASYITFDDLSLLAAATQDPTQFIQGLSLPITIDEAQLVPPLFRAIKKRIDENRYLTTAHNGRFLITGSSSIETLPIISNALVGRISIITLLPLSAREIAKKYNSICEILFHNDTLPTSSARSPLSLTQAIQQATYPQITAEHIDDTATWFKNYTTTLIQRDLKQIMDIQKLSSIPQLLRILAHRCGGIINDSSLSRDTGLNIMTLRRYRTVLQQMFLITTLPPWHRNIGKRFIKSPKLYFIDTMLLGYIRGLIPNQQTHPEHYGTIIENFVASELFKQLALCPDITLYYYRTHDHKEIDFILERNDGSIVAIEVKSRASVSYKDFSTMLELKNSIGTSFCKGIVLYTGDTIIPFDNNLFAVPISFLWE
jgi:uncharacterized protein